MGLVQLIEPVISHCSRALSFLNALRPPVEPGGGADEVATALEGDATPGLRLFQLVEIGEVAVDEDGVGEWPEMFGGLKLGGIRRQEEQVDVVGHAQFDARVPASAIQHQHDLLVGSGPRLLGESSELDLEDLDTHIRGEVEKGATRGGMDEADEVAPGEAVLYDGVESRTATRRPDAPEQRFEANSMLVGGPELDPGMGKRGGHLAQEWPYLF